MIVVTDRRIVYLSISKIHHNFSDTWSTYSQSFKRIILYSVNWKERTREPCYVHELYLNLYNVSYNFFFLFVADQTANLLDDAEDEDLLFK